MRNYRNPIPPPPHPETEPRPPEDPDVGEQFFAIPAVFTVALQNPLGTAITAPITNEVFYFFFTSGGGAAERGLDIPVTITGTNTLTVVSSNIRVVGDPGGRVNPSYDEYVTFYARVVVSGYGSGTINLPAAAIDQPAYFYEAGRSYQFIVTFSPRSFAISLARHPVVTISGAQNPVGTFLDEEINHTSFYVDFTWDLPTSASFTAADITATSSNTSMTVTKGSLENTGTVGTSTHYRMLFTIGGAGISTITVTVLAGAVPAASPNEASEVRARTFEVNTYPTPVATLGAAQDSDGNALDLPITATTFFVPITWNLNVGTAFTDADLNLVTNNASLRATVVGLSTTTPGRSYIAEISLSGGGAGVVTLYTNRGAIPATASTSSSVVSRSVYNANLPPLPPPVGTMSGPSSTQSGGSVLLRPDDITDVDPPILDVIIGNVDAARQTSNIPVDVTVSFVFDKPVRGFGQATPNYRFIPRGVDASVPTKIPQLGTFSGVDGNATYEQIIEIQPDSAGKINVFVAPMTASLVSDSDVYGPEPPGEMHEIFYDTTIAGNPAPNVNISTPPTTYFTGATFTTTFTWDQPIERNTFRTSQVFVSGASKGALTPDPNRRDVFTMELTLPDAGVGEVTISVFASRIVSTAARGIVSRREGPEVTVSETFQYDRGYSSPGKVVQGASTICEITEPIATNTYLDGAVTPRSYGGAFAGVSDMVYVEDPVTGRPYLYLVCQQIKRKRGT